jgi:PAS domain S-box-containing protein
MLVDDILYVLYQNSTLLIATLSVFLLAAVLVGGTVITRGRFTREKSSFSLKYMHSALQDKFKPAKTLGMKEQIMLAMLQDKNADNVPVPSFVVTDPHFIENPIVFASSGFCELTGYNKKEIERRNCRFLQGKDTDPAHVQMIRDAVLEEKDAAVQLLNYRKDGTPFLNCFFICPLRSSDGEIQYFLGVQREAPDGEDVTIKDNAGYRLFRSL